MMTFDIAMDRLCDALTRDAMKYYATYSHIKSVAFKPCGGKKYIRVKSFENVSKDMEATTFKGGRIHCFVNSETGDIYKPATWRAPYLRGRNYVRGNIFKPETYKDTDPHGGWLYDRSSRNS